ncbi:MAG TPA: DUF4829 domain-containing protein, partial [Clostridium sp.]|nr:DUF4829 domain-containing protein [Clostridium sp.]
MKKLILLLITIALSIGLMACNSSTQDSLEDSKSVVENHFIYQNEKNKDKLLTTLTNHYKQGNTDWELDNLGSIKIVNINEELNEGIRNNYLRNGRGSINNITSENLKVYKVDYEVKYKRDGIGPQDSGTYE